MELINPGRLGETDIKIANAALQFCSNESRQVVWQGQDKRLTTPLEYL